jgi:hypothetical protein
MGATKLLLRGDVPRLFKFLPLVNSVNIGLPAVFYSPQFLTTENRDGLVFSGAGPHSDVNKGLLTKAAKCFLRLTRNCAEEGVADLYLLLDVSAVSNFPAWLEDQSWYADWQRSIIRELAGIPLVGLDNEETAPVSDAHLSRYRGGYILGASDLNLRGAGLRQTLALDPFGCPNLALRAVFAN